MDNRDRNINAAFYPHPYDHFYPGNNPFFDGDPLSLDFSGPIEIWKLINPPAQAYEPETADNITTRIRPDGGLETIGGFWTALDVRNGKILWQRPAITNGGGLWDEFGNLDLVNRVATASPYATLHFKCVTK